MLRQRNGVSDALRCECQTKTQNQHVPTQRWKQPDPTHPPDGRSRFGKCGVVRTVCLGYCPDSGSGDWVQSCQTGTSMIYMSHCLFYCFLTLLFAAVVGPFLHPGLFSNKQLKPSNYFSPLVPILTPLYPNRVFLTLLFWSSQPSLLLLRWFPRPCQVQSLKVPSAPLQCWWGLAVFHVILLYPTIKCHHPSWHCLWFC